jgi:hypothetical protein
MEKKSVKDTEILRRIHLTRVLAGDVKISFKEGRPNERGVIKHEDIIDLKILLNTAKSLNDFLYQC